MDDELKALLEQLSVALREQIRSTEQLQELLREIEARGYRVSLTLGVVQARSDDTSGEVQESLLGPAGAPERPSATRRISAFDRKFLRALRIQIPN